MAWYARTLVMQVSQLWIYPVKSCQGISLSSCHVGPSGLHCDRKWMLLDEQDQVLTQRTVPALARIGTTVWGDCIAMNIPGQAHPLILNHNHPGTDDVISTQIWDEPISVVETSPKMSQALTSFLEMPVKLVQLAPGYHRYKTKPRLFPDAFTMQLADGSPVTLTNPASLAQLCLHIAEPIPMSRFRPNVVVTGVAAYEEDEWQAIQIGQIRFPWIFPRHRCVVTTIDQSTGINASPEPLRTLARDRRRGEHVDFGMSLVSQNAGEIALGDVVKVVRSV